MAAKKPITINWDKAGLGERLDSEIAKDFNVPRRRVTKERAKRNIAAYTKSHPNVKVDRTRRVDASQPATKPITQVVAQSPVSAATPPQKPAPKKKATLTNYIAVVIDESGSMDHLQSDVINVFNGLSQTIRENAKATDQETKVSLWTFQTNVKEVFNKVDAENVGQLDHLTYRPGGLTALYDAVAKAINSFKLAPDANDENTSFLIIVITDGEENSSRLYDRSNRGGERLAELMLEVQRTGRWSMVFQVPPGQRNRVISEFKIPSDNVREWEATRKGITETSQVTNSGIGTYYLSRASGQKSVTNFFTTDLSKLKVSEVKKKLDDISNKFKAFVVDKEVDIKEFVEAKTKRAYVVGSTYYTFMKPEEVQPQKQVLLRQKGHLAIWGGDEARKLIGLPQGVKAKVTPGNHSEYDVFVQSTSVNRKLPRGTQVLVDMTKLTNDAETWNSGYTTS